MMKHAWWPVILVLAACTSQPSQPQGSSSDSAAAEPVPAASEASDIATELPRYHWRLREATGADGKRLDALLVRADQPVTLDFAEGRLGVANTCNRMGGTYTLQGNRLTVARLVSTMMACADPRLMALDREAGSRLEGTSTIALQAGSDAPRLTLTTAQGEVLGFAGEATATTRYGSTGETVFLEVAAQTAPCPHPLIRDKQCLQVREVRYDAQGNRQGTPGAFENFYTDIEGYAHEPGIRNVLRVQRYPIANPPADAPSAAYVLDTVVESENVQP